MSSFLDVGMVDVLVNWCARFGIPSQVFSGLIGRFIFDSHPPRFKEVLIIFLSFKPMVDRVFLSARWYWIVLLSVEIHDGVVAE